MVDPLLIIHVIILLFVAISIHRRVGHQPLGAYFLPGLALKMIAGIGIGVIYFFYYKGGDTILFHEDGVRLSRALYESPGQYLQILLYNSQANEIWGQLKLAEQPRALLVAKIVSVLHTFTNENYWITGLYFTLFAYSGLWSLANKLSLYFPWTRTAGVVAFLFFPSVVFWSSGITKESIAIGCMTWIVSLYVPFFSRGEVIHNRQALLSLFFLMLLWVLKYYYAAVLVAVLMPTLIVGFFKNRRVGVHWQFSRQLLYWVSFLVWFTVIASFLHPNLRLDSMLGVIVSNHDLFIQISKPENIIEFNELAPNFGSFILNFPTALWAGLFQPLPWEVDVYPAKLVSFENAFLLSFSGLSLLSLLRLNRSNNGLLAIACITFVVLLAAFLTFSTPNLGTLARYKTGFLPFFIFIILADPPTKRLIVFFKKYFPGKT